MEKKCNKCGEVKNFSEFNKNNSTKSGLRSYCKTCQKEYYKANADKLKERSKKYYKDNADKIKEYRKANADKIKESEKKYYKANSDKIKERKKKYYKANADKIKERKKKYDKANADKIKERKKKYNKANADKIKEWRKEYQKNREKNDPIFKLTNRLRSNIRDTFKRACNGAYVKKSKTVDILGCDMDFFMRYISSKFQKGMTFENYGEWHLDHIIPISEANTKEDIIRLNHYTNFQPLWAEDNLTKSDKIVEQQLTLL